MGHSSPIESLAVVSDCRDCRLWRFSAMGFAIWVTILDLFWEIALPTTTSKTKRVGKRICAENSWGTRLGCHVSVTGSMYVGDPNWSGAQCSLQKGRVYYDCPSLEKMSYCSVLVWRLVVIWQNPQPPAATTTTTRRTRTRTTAAAAAAKQRTMGFNTA